MARTLVFGMSMVGASSPIFAFSSTGGSDSESEYGRFNTFLAAEFSFVSLPWPPTSPANSSFFLVFLTLNEGACCSS